MNFVETNFEGVFLVEPTPYRDHRGLFRRHYCYREFEEAGSGFSILQTNISENTINNTLRGFHLQLPPHGEKKFLSCLRGSIYGIVLDLRPDSNSYKTWMSYEISSENRKGLILPEGCANAYLTLAPTTWIFYCHSQYYLPSSVFGIRFNDTNFDFSWPTTPDLVSEKDLSYPTFVEANYLTLVK